MIYLSRLMLNPWSRAVQRDLANCQDMHRTLLSAFGESEVSVRRMFGVLYRVEPTQRTLRVLVQSRAKPDWGTLRPGYLVADEDSAICRRVDDVYARLQVGQSLRFRLRANPTKRLLGPPQGIGTHARGKRVDLRREEDRLAWLARKAERGGFSLLTVHTAPAVLNARANAEPRQVGWSGEGKMIFGAAVFEGVLRITDTDRFGMSLADGIGSAKAYGFGLLSIAATAT
jgi:CRISPR system Cascade subunit CasE